MEGTSRKVTMSMCPVCYNTIPAYVFEKGGAIYMIKQCPQHGYFTSLVERDAKWYDQCMRWGCNNIYNGILIDVTNNCNMKCKHCYHDNNGEHRSVDSIVAEAMDHRDKAPFILTGGEPSTHPQITEIISALSAMGEVHILTNGKGITDKTIFEWMKAGLTAHNSENILDMTLSHHDEGDFQILDVCRDMGLKVWTCLWVIDDIAQIEEVIDTLVPYSDVLHSIRIKAASNLWKTKDVENKIFVSDMINYLAMFGDMKFTVQGVYNKTSYGNVMWNGRRIELVSWYDVTNVDLYDINCPPFYKANDGSINNFVTSALINEGMDRTSGTRIRRAVEGDIPTITALWVEMAKEEDPSCNPHPEIWAAQARQFIKDPNHNHLYVAEISGVMVGFVQGFWRDDPVSGDRHIIGTHIYSKPEHRAAGIGSMLYKRYREVAKRLGVTKIIKQANPEYAEYLKSKGHVERAVIMEESV